jgi:hypothetical protein
MIDIARVSLSTEEAYGKGYQVYHMPKADLYDGIQAVMQLSVSARFGNK